MSLGTSGRSLKRSWLIAALLIWTFAPFARAGITVTSYETLAETNGFAPSLMGPYFAQQTLENVTPALAQVSGDWTGPNADGTPDTWHFVGTAQSNSATTFDSNRYTVTGAGSFEYELDTTADFVDPSSVNIFGPGGVANYNGFFKTDAFTTYAISAQLTQRSRVRFNSLSGLVVFDQSNHTSVPMLVNLTGVIPPGRYQVLFTTSFGTPNLPNGVIHARASGSFDNLTFVVQVPEPRALAVMISIIGTCLRRRGSSRPR